jgi:hypothetical protein
MATTGGSRIVLVRNLSFRAAAFSCSEFLLLLMNFNVFSHQLL